VPIDNKDTTELGRSFDAQFYFDLEKEDPNDPAQGWKKRTEVSDKKQGFDVTVHGKQQQDGRSVMRQDMKLFGIQADTFDKYMMDMENQIKDEPQMKVMDVLERTEDGMPSLMYYKMKLTMMSDRECVMRMTKIP